jgi:hypothetical protein
VARTHYYYFTSHLADFSALTVSAMGSVAEPEPQGAERSHNDLVEPEPQRDAAPALTAPALNLILYIDRF